MKLIKRATALLLCFLMLTNGSISAFATESVSDNDAVAAFPAVTADSATSGYVESEESIALDFLPAGLIAESESVAGTTAVITANPVALYKSLDNGAEGIEVAVESGTVIDLITKYTFTTDSGDLVFYRYDYYGSNEALNDAALSETSGYVFIYSEDISVENTDKPGSSGSEDVTVETDKTDKATGVVVSAELPEDVTLTVTEKSVEESGLDTTIYPISGASLFYDITLLQNSAEYQPENGVTVTFPEAAIVNSGLAVGDYYKVYHIHDDATDVTGPFEYTGGSISVDFANLSVVGISESTIGIDLTTLFGAYVSEENYYAWATITADTVNVYGAVNSDSTDTYALTGANGVTVEVIKKATYENGVLYQIAYRGDDTEIQNIFANVNNYFIPETYLTFTCTCNCGYCTGTSDCTCCDNCTCGDELTLTDSTTGIIVTGVLPAGTQLVVSDATTSTIPGLDITHLAYKTVSYAGYNISLVDADGNALADDAFETVTVYVPGVWNTSYSDPIVDVYHLNDDGTLNEMLTTRNGTVALMEGGGVVFKVSSFSNYAFVSGDTDSNISVTQGTHTIYIAPGSTGTLTLQSTNNVNLSTTTPVSGVTVSRSASWNTTTFTITAADTAVLNSTGTFTITSQGGMQAEGGPPDKNDHESNQTRTATYTVKVVTAEEAAKQQFMGNSIGHIQINIESSAVVLGYNDDQATTIDLNYDESNSTNTLEKVSDDSSVGFHYELTYTVDEVETTVIVRVDESATKLPTGVTYADIASKWSLTGTSEEESQISFNGSIPVGTKEYPIVYSVTVESTFELVPNGNLTDDDSTNDAVTEEVNVSISNNMGYWYSTNECPGLGHSSSDWEAGSVISGSGIDLSKFTMGSVLGDITYYVVFSNLTKVVSGYTFGEGESKNYVFTICRRTADTTDGDDWTAFDSISITASGATSSTNFTTDATKYSVDDIDKYEYKIVETGYSISGYGCTNKIEVKSGDNYAESSDGIFTFSRSASADGKTVTYSAEIKCTNTYTEAGLTVSKVTENAPAGTAYDEFAVKVWPNVLSTTGVNLGDGQTMITYFNNGTYKVGDTTLPVTVGTDDSYGYITLTLKGGESKTITGLPAGTYYVQEVDGTSTNANWTYDSTQYAVNLSSGSATVTVTNTYKYADLTIEKTGWNDIDEYQSFIFTVTGPNGFNMDVVINGNGSVTIKDLLIGEYTVTENTDWSWRYTPDGNDKKITLVANGNNTVNFSNTRSWNDWLSGDSCNENQFTVKSKDEE